MRHRRPLVRVPIACPLAFPSARSYMLYDTHALTHIPAFDLTNFFIYRLCRKISRPPASSLAFSILVHFRLATFSISWLHSPFLIPFLPNPRLYSSTVVIALLLALFFHLLCPLFLPFFYRHSVSSLHESTPRHSTASVSFSKKVNCARCLSSSSSSFLLLVGKGTKLELAADVIASARTSSKRVRLSVSLIYPSTNI